MHTPKRSDRPLLLRLRDAYRVMIQAAMNARAGEKDPGMLIAYANVIDDLQVKFERTGRLLSKLERSPC
jgi:hypothetical protein